MILFPFSLQDPIAATALFWARALYVQAWSLHPREKKEMGKWESAPGVWFCFLQEEETNSISVSQRKNWKTWKVQGVELSWFVSCRKERKKAFETLSGWSHEDNDKSFQSLSLT
jgi:hypothetical protein